MQALPGGSGRAIAGWATTVAVLVAACGAGGDLEVAQESTVPVFTAREASVIDGQQMAAGEQVELALDEQIVAQGTLQMQEDLVFETLRGDTVMTITRSEPDVVEAFLTSGHLRVELDEASSRRLTMQTFNEAELTTLRADTVFTVCQAPTGGICLIVEKGEVEWALEGSAPTVVGPETSSFAAIGEPPGPLICVLDEAYDEWLAAARRDDQPRALTALVAEYGECQGDDLAAYRLGTAVEVAAPAGIATGGGRVWVTNFQGTAVTVIDADSSAVIAEVDVGGGSDPRPINMLVTGSDVWVVLAGAAEIVRIDTEQLVVTERIPVSGTPTSIAAGAGSLWVTSRDGTLTRIDPERGEVVDTVAIGTELVDVVVAESGVWTSDLGSNTVTRLDPDTMATVAVDVGAGQRDIARGFGAIWVAVTSGEVARIDTDTNDVTSIVLGPDPTGITTDGESVFVRTRPALVRLDPETLAHEDIATFQGDPATEDLALEDNVGRLAVARGTVWIPSRRGDSVKRFDRVDR